MKIPAVTSSPSPTPGRSERSEEDSSRLYSLAACLVIATTTWFLLKELAPLLRPLILAVFLGYIVIPIHHRLGRHTSSTTAAVVIVGGTVLLLYGLAMMVCGSIVELNADLPRLIGRARRILEEVRAYGHAHLPPWLMESSPNSAEADVQFWTSVRVSIRGLLPAAAGMLAEAFVVGIYLVFSLLEVRRLPHRIRAGFGPERAESFLGVMRRINAAMTGYLRAKVVTSLVTAVPTAVVLWAFGVKFPVMWGVLAFFGNFIPYVGGLVAFTFPVLLAFLDLEPAWRPCAAALLLILIQVATNNFVEPTLTGKAVDLSPLVTLVALAFWGLCWGLTGMLLAVPLTAMLKIVWENVPYTRPLAILMSEGDGSPSRPGG